MSVAEILAELPKLDPVELQLVFQNIVEIRQNTELEISPELAKAIDEALAEPEEACLDLDEVRRLVKSWNLKYLHAVCRDGPGKNRRILKRAKSFRIGGISHKTFRSCGYFEPVAV